MLLGWNYWNCRYIESIPWKSGFSKPLIPFGYHINSEG
jgi:hypothetical protein